MKEATFYNVLNFPGASSLYQPQGPFLDLYGGSKYFEAHGDYEEIPVETSTVDIELDKLGINRIDLVKIDVQGSELDVLRGMK